MSYKVVFEFDSEDARDLFLSNFADCGSEEYVAEAMFMQGQDVTFDYANAFIAWGWDGQGDPTVAVNLD
jgi:hypothetical protein